MKPLETILKDVNEAIERYETCKLGLIADQSEILRTLSVNYGYLTDYRIKYHEEWLSVYFNSKGSSSAAKEREADNVVRGLYTVRHFMNSISKVMDSIRSTISVNKTNG